MYVYVCALYTVVGGYEASDGNKASSSAAARRALSRGAQHARLRLKAAEPADPAHADATPCPQLLPPPPFLPASQTERPWRIGDAARSNKRCCCLLRTDVEERALRQGFFDRMGETFNVAAARISIAPGARTHARKDAA